MTDPPAAGRLGVRQLAGAVICFLSLALLLTAGTWRDPVNRWTGGCCDQEQTIWYLAWLPSALEAGQNPLITDRLNAPDGANLMWNTPTPLIALLATPLTRTVGPIFAYNVAVLAALVLSGLACFLALRRYTDRPLAPLIGAAVYELSPYMATQAGIHLNLTNAWAPPVFLILLDELFVRRRQRPELLGAAMGVVGALQVLTFEEVLATSAVAGLCLVLLIALAVRDRERILASVRRGLRALLPGLATFLVLAGGPLLVQFLGPQQVHGRLLPTTTFSTDLLNVLLPTSHQLLAPDWLIEGVPARGMDRGVGAYIGIPLLLVLGWIVVARRHDVRALIAAAMAVLMFVFSLGPELRVGGQSVHLPMPWLPIGNLPLLEHALPSRLVLFMWLAIGVLVALGIDHGLRMPGRQGAARVGIVAVALVFTLPVPLGSTTIPVPDFFRSWDSQGIASDEIVLTAPWINDGAGSDAMLWSAFADARPRLHEGYVFVPGRGGRPRYGPRPGLLGQAMLDVESSGVVPTVTGATRGAFLGELAQWGIDDVVVGPMRHRDEMVAMFTDLLGRPPVETGGVELWRNVAELLPAAANRP